MLVIDVDVDPVWGLPLGSELMPFLERLQRLWRNGLEIDWLVCWFGLGELSKGRSLLLWESSVGSEWILWWIRLNLHMVDAYRRLLWDLVGVGL